MNKGNNWINVSDRPAPRSWSSAAVGRDQLDANRHRFRVLLNRQMPPSLVIQHVPGQKKRFERPAWPAKGATTRAAACLDTSALRPVD
jgi:hypothetical protein